ncbi:conserved protein of unknown function [Acetoanaerobium sticklandii]|uniref:HTH cro/C1-type domain-containing protein n=1 Tax=Acetoanaerobium sticklandii (strain ATCC 12662 / DSM 519 / JCM 1433 / CCUG 9281 / NCIMB 10654 / HF) TaxID=499177 RepID=E3PS26_ACESD|nr:helix-turn-helix domain-containing protein [Acetoanaerobium sticklandii]CBH21680.1 conserved protein of unknown function [Acetoanaerobium sticklandii]
MPEQVKLKGLMTENKMFQKDLAKIIGVSEKTVNDKVNGNIDFKLSEALSIANYFGKSIEEIFLGQKLI